MKESLDFKKDDVWSEYDGEENTELGTEQGTEQGVENEIHQFKEYGRKPYNPRVNAKYISIDIISDGETPANSNMIQLAAVVVEKTINRKFEGKILPIFENRSSQTYNRLGMSYDDVMLSDEYQDASYVMDNFVRWVDEIADGRHVIFVSDNPAFDWQFINHYLHLYYGSNPYSHSVRRLGDLWSGRQSNMLDNGWKYRRKNGYGYSALNIAIGNAYVLRGMFFSGLKF
jgi:hypothetical protein